MNFADFRFWLLLVPALAVLLAWQRLGAARVARDNTVDRALLTALSLGLFAAAAPSSLWLFLVELAVNYALALRIIGASSDAARKRWLAGTVVLDLLVLAAFKYDRFLLEGVFGSGAVHAQLRGFLPGDGGIPPGISFYTFQMIAFAVDTSRAGAQARAPRLLDYVCFTAFFPQLVAGPIERRERLLPQIEQFRVRMSWRSLDHALRFVSVGLFLKLVLADHLGALIDTRVVGNAWGVWLACIGFGCRIYFDFAGYSLIALGLGRLVGVELTLNFVAPYFARDLPELWRRWHVTLSGWFRDYVYVPLGGGSRAAARNILIVFLLSGLWHGAGWNFVLWGAVHGLALVLHRAASRRLRLPPALSRAWMLVVVFAAWLPFFQTDADLLLAQGLTLVTPSAYAPALLLAVGPQAVADRALLVVVTLFAAGVLALEGRGAQRDPAQPYALLASRAVAPVLLFLVLLLRARDASPFIYFAF